MKKWMFVLAGAAIVILVVVIMFTRGEEPVKERPAAAETPTVIKPSATAVTPTEKAVSLQPTPSPVKEDGKETAVLETKIIKMTIEEFFSEFDKPGTVEKYKGETVQLLGKVKEIEKTPEGYLASFYSVGLSDRIVRGSFREIPSIEPGQKAVFQGEVIDRSVFEGSFMEARRETITLINCILAPPVRISAKDLHSEFEKNPVTAELKYKIELLEVTGTIGKIEMGPSGKVTVNLSDAGYAGVRLNFTDEREKIATLSKGEKITVRGWLDTFRPMLSLDVVLQDVRLLD